MDRLSSLEYSLMRDIYDDYAAESYDYDDDYALESYDDYDGYDDYASQYDGYDYDEAFEGSKEPKAPKAPKVPKPGSFGQYMKVSSKGKIRAFFRAVINRIATFFKKLGLRIKMLFTKKENKDAVRARIAELEQDNAIVNAAGRLADICRRAKKPAIKSVEAVRKIVRVGGRVKGYEEFDKCVDLINYACEEIDNCTQDVESLKQHLNDRDANIAFPKVIAVCTYKHGAVLDELSDTALKVGSEYDNLNRDIEDLFLHEYPIINDDGDRDTDYYYDTVAGRRRKNRGTSKDINDSLKNIATGLNNLINGFNKFSIATGMKSDPDRTRRANFNKRIDYASQYRR